MDFCYIIIKDSSTKKDYSYSTGYCIDICIEDRKYEEDRLKKTFQVIESQLVEAEK